MNYGKMFAWLLVTLDIVASGGYAIQHDWRRSLYWVFSACIQTTLTY